MSLEATHTHQPKAITPPPASGLLQRKCACGNHTVAGGECEACRKKRLQRKATGQAELTAVPAIVHEVLRSSGRPLDPTTRAFMEPRFRHDFSSVRVHTDAQAAESARAVQAQAYTVGRNVVFADGKYAPGISAGKQLLAHELTHVVQQSRAGRSAVSFSERVAEAEADQNAALISGTQPCAMNITPGTAVLQRQADTESVETKAVADEADKIVRAAERVRKDPNSHTRVNLSAFEIVYRLIHLFLPDYANRISYVGYEENLKGVRVDISQASISITIGKQFVSATNEKTLEVRALELGTAIFAKAPRDKSKQHGLVYDTFLEPRRAAKEHHYKQQRLVVDFLSKVPRGAAPDVTSERTDPEMLLRNSVQWLDARKIHLFILTQTHDSTTRNPGTVAYFDKTVEHPNIGGDYPIRRPAQLADDKAVVYKVQEPGHVVKAQAFTDQISFFLTDFNEENFRVDFVHEMQHVADQVGGQAAMRLGTMSPLQGAILNYQTEFRAYWTHPQKPPPKTVTTGGGGSSGGLTFPSGTPWRPAHLDFGSPLEKAANYGPINAKKPELCRSVCVQPAPAKGSGNSQKQPNLTSTTEKTKFKNKKQEDIFYYIRDHYDIVDCYYICSEEYRNMVHDFSQPVGVNLINSVRIEDLSRAVQRCQNSMNVNDLAVQAILIAAQKLDATDRAFMKDASASADFWKQVDQRLPKTARLTIEQAIKK